MIMAKWEHLSEKVDAFLVYVIAHFTSPRFGTSTVVELRYQKEKEKSHVNDTVTFV